MKLRAALLVTALTIPALSMAEGDCQPSKTQPQAFGDLTLSCATAIMDYDKSLGTRRACAELTVPNSDEIIKFMSDPFTAEDKSDRQLRDHVCLQAALKVSL